MTTTVRWLRSSEELARDEDTLRNIAGSAGRPQPAADPDFVQSYIRHFEYSPSPPTPEVAIVERDGAPIGFLATRVSPRTVAPGFSVRERSLLVTHDHDRVTMVSAPDDEAVVADALAVALLASNGSSALDIAALEAGSALHLALHDRAKRSRSWVAFDVVLPSFCSVPVQWNSMDGYFRALSKSMRSNVSRQARRLFAAGNVELIRAVGAGQVAPLFSAYLDLEQRSWKYPMDAGILRSPKRTAFFADVVSGRAAYEPSMVGVVLDGELIAGLLLGRFGTGMWALEMCFDEDRRELGGGQVLLLLAMQEAIRSGCTAVGYLQHFAYFKTRWLASETAVVSTRVVRRGSPLHIRHLLGESARRRTSATSTETETETDTARGAASATNSADPNLATPDRRGPQTGGPADRLEAHDDRPHRHPDATDASRRLLATGLRPGVLIDTAAAHGLLPFPLR